MNAKRLVKTSRPPEPVRVYQATSLVEAVEMATRFKAKGTYDWFRGQTRNWQVVPTLVRLNKTEFKANRERQRWFCNWLFETPGLERLREDPTDAMAIAQHYGLSTPFLDFTTNPGVAGYFASSEKPSKTEPSCIYCLNTKDLVSMWTFMRKVLPHYPKLQLVTVTVPDLWRLEAQQGVFVECACNWTVRYPIDRIEFPATLPPSSPTRDQIYPERKSQLELLLDHYFEADKIAAFDRFIRKKLPRMKIHRVNAPTEGYFPEYFQPEGLPELRDWGKTRLRHWLKVPVEHYRRTVIGEIPLFLNLKLPAKELGEAAAYGVRRALDTEPRLRNRAVRWAVEPKGRLPRRLAAGLEKLWNGVRRQPYSAAQIAAAVGLCFELYRAGFLAAEMPEERKAVFEQCSGRCIRVEFSSWEGNPVQAWATVDALTAAVRPDIAEYLAEEHRIHAGNIRPLLQLCSNHRRLFVFDRFADLFIRQVVPVQVLSESRAAHFSPARLVGFGLP